MHKTEFNWNSIAIQMEFLSFVCMWSRLILLISKYRRWNKLQVWYWSTPRIDNEPMKIINLSSTYHVRRNCENNKKWSWSGSERLESRTRESNAVVLAISRRKRETRRNTRVRVSPKSSWKPVTKAGSRQRGWMRVTLTKHRGHGAKPLSRENKEILSSFVRPSPPVSVSPRLSLSLPTFISLPLSLSLTFIYFYLPLLSISWAVFTLVVVLSTLTSGPLQDHSRLEGNSRESISSKPIHFI